MMPSLHIQQPWVLLLLPLVYFLWHQQKHSLSPLSKDRKHLSLLLRSSLFILLLFALADIRWHAVSHRTAVAWLIDASDSLGDQAIQRFASLQDQGLPVADTQQTILFAGSAASLSADNQDTETDRKPLHPEKTDLQQALLFAEAMLPDDHVRTVFLLSDGRSLDRQWERVIERLRTSGIRVHTITQQPSDHPEVLVQRLEAPTRIRKNEPFLVEAAITSNREQAATLTVFRNGVQIESRPVSLLPGRNTFRFSQVIQGENLTEYIIRIEATEDTILDNNERSALVESTGEPRVLLVTDHPLQSRHLAWAMRQEGIQMDVRPDTGVPDSFSDLQNYELLIFDNVPANLLSPRQFTLIAEWVRVFGGGFLMVGGDKSFGLGGYHRTTIDDLLPLRSDFTMQEDHPSTALLLIIDKSGSMGGERIEMARDAATGAIELLTQNDYAGVIVFDGDAYWAAEMQSLVARHSILRAIAGISASGGTNLEPALQLALTAMPSVPGKIKHVIILSDGHSGGGQFIELTKQLRQFGVTTSTVAVGQGSDVNMLEDIAKAGNGRYYYTERNTDVPQILARETMTATNLALNEVPVSVQQHMHAPFLRNIDFTNAPFLYGHVRTEFRPTAELWLTTDEGAPLLATWRVGLGHVGAFSSDTRARWATEWLRWEAYSRFWAQTFRHLMRSTDHQPYAVTLTEQQDHHLLTLDVLDKQGEFLMDANGTLVVVHPDGNHSSLPLRQQGPGRYLTNIPTSQRGNYHLNITLTDSQSENVLQHSTAFSVGYPEEYLLGPPDHDLLRTLAQQTGGTANPDDLHALLQQDDRRSTRQHELWPWLVAVTLLLFLADIAAKRLPSSNPS